MKSSSKVLLSGLLIDLYGPSRGGRYEGDRKHLAVWTLGGTLQSSENNKVATFGFSLILGYGILAHLDVE